MHLHQKLGGHGSTLLRNVKCFTNLISQNDLFSQKIIFQMHLHQNFLLKFTNYRNFVEFL